MNNTYLSKIELLSNTNKYTTWYKSIVSAAIERVDYTLSKRQQRITIKKKFPEIEAHHILPKCMCSDDTEKKDKFNLVYLTPREHLLLHCLLCKMLVNRKHILQMVNAAIRLTSNGTMNSRDYDRIKRLIIRHKKGQRTKPMTEQTKQKISASRLGQPAWNKGVSHLKGVPKSDSMKEKLSIVMSGNKSKSSNWKITDLKTNNESVVYNLKSYCQENGIEYDRLFYYIKNKNGIVPFLSLQFSKISD